MWELISYGYLLSYDLVINIIKLTSCDPPWIILVAINMGLLCLYDFKCVAVLYFHLIESFTKVDILKSLLLGRKQCRKAHVLQNDIKSVCVNILAPMRTELRAFDHHRDGVSLGLKLRSGSAKGGVAVGTLDPELINFSPPGYQWKIRQVLFLGEDTGNHRHPTFTPSAAHQIMKVS